jgi:hypothetical protein
MHRDVREKDAPDVAIATMRFNFADLGASALIDPGPGSSFLF